MDITGLTRPQVQSPPTPRPASDPVPPTQAAVDAIVSHNESKIRSGLRIRVDEATNQVVVEIVNAENEVIRQIPPEEMLRLDALFKRITGIIFDQEA